MRDQRSRKLLHVANGSLAVLAFLVAGVSLALAETGTEDRGVMELIQKAKSGKREERAGAVRELLLQRGALADALIGIVNQASEGKVDTESKAVALYLMGALGLVECREILVAEQGWKRVVEDRAEMTRLNADERRRMDWLVGFPARVALEIGGFQSLSTTKTTGERELRELSGWPQLAVAVEDLASRERQKRRVGERAVLQWYGVVCESMGEVLRPTHTYPDEVRATAAYVLGEFRTPDQTVLTWSIDLVDESGTCSEYPATLSVKTDKSRYPCVVALLKLGGRASIDQALSRIETQDLVESARDLLVQTLLTLDAERTRRLYHARVEGLAAAVERYPEAEADRREAKQADVRVKGMLRGPPGSSAAERRETARAAARLPALRLRNRARLERLLAIRSIVEERARSGRGR